MRCCWRSSGRARSSSIASARLLHEAIDRNDGHPPVREVLAVLFAPPLRWFYASDRKRISPQFILRARAEGTQPMRDTLQSDASHLARFVVALRIACPDLPDETLHWRLNFCLGLIHNNRIADFERLHRLSGGSTRAIDAEAVLERMLDFAEAGMRV